MSTPIVQFDNEGSGFSGQNIGFGALELYVAVSLPLMCLTFVAWYFVYWREKRKDKKKMGEQQKGGEIV